MKYIFFMKAPQGRRDKIAKQRVLFSHLAPASFKNIIRFYEMRKTIAGRYGFGISQEKSCSHNKFKSMTRDFGKERERNN